MTFGESPGAPITELDGRVANPKLPRVTVTVGGVETEGVVDTGAEANIISARLVEAAGLAAVPLGDQSFGVSGVLGKEGRCEYWVTNLPVYLTPQKLVTYANFHILEGASEPLLLGRTWGTLNGVGIREAKRGTYVSWISGDARYEVLASKAGERELGDPRMIAMGVRQPTKTNDSEDEAIKVYAVNTHKAEEPDQSYVPDSEESRLAPDFLEVDQRSEAELEQLETLRWAKDRVAEWKKGMLREIDDADDEGEDEEEVRSRTDREWTPPPNQLDKGKGKAREDDEESEGSSGRPHKKQRVRNSRNKLMKVDQAVEESFTRLEQMEADEGEWELFCSREGKRLARHNEQWRKWIEDSEEGDVPGVISDHGSLERVEFSRVRESSRPRSIEDPELSQTLESYPPMPTKVVRREEGSSRRPKSTEVSVRRSSRVRRRTERGQYNDDIQGRTYERREKISRKIVQRKRPALMDDEPTETRGPQNLRVFCLRVRPDEIDEVEMADRSRTRKGWFSRRPKGDGERRDQLRPGNVLGRQTPLPTFPENGTDRVWNLSRDRNVRQGTREAQEEAYYYLDERRRRSSPQPIREPWTVHGRDKELPVIPVQRGMSAPDYDSDESVDGLSIIEPVARLVNYKDAEMNHGPTVKTHSRIRKPRPDSVVDPYIVGASRRNIPIEQGRAVNTRWANPVEDPRLHDDQGTTRGPLGDYPESVQTSDRNLRRHKRNQDVMDAEQLERWRWPTTEEQALPDHLRSQFEWDEEDTNRHLPRREGEKARRVARKRAIPNIRKVFLVRMAKEEGDEKADHCYEMTQEGPAGSGDGEMEKEAEETRVQEIACRLIEPEEAAPDPKTRRVRRKQEDDKEGKPTTIRTRRTARRIPHQSTWLQQTVQYLKQLTPTDNNLRVLLVLPLLLVTISLLSTIGLPNAYLPMTNLKQTESPTSHSSRDSGHRVNRYESFGVTPIDPQGWARSPTSLLNEDPAKAVLDTIQAPADDRMIQGIVAIRHMVPLVGESSLSTREFVGRATLGSIRYPNGAVEQVHGDVHLRFFAKGVEFGWTGVTTPSRTEVGYLRKVLFREAGFEKVMDQMRNGFKGTQPFLIGSGVEEQKERGEVRVKEEEKESWMKHGEKGVKVPPNTPNDMIKIGPPKRKGTVTLFDALLKVADDRHLAKEFQLE